MDLKEKSLPEITIKAVILGVVLGFVRRDDGVCLNTSSGSIDGGTEVVSTQQYLREQHCSNCGLGG